MPMKIYVINLPRNVERMENMARQLAALGLSFERSDACDGYAMSDSELNAAEKARPLENWASPGHIGCLFSHVSLWKRIADGADAYACIMEDDVHISPTFARFLKHEESFPKNFDLIRCEYSPGRLLLSRRAIFTDVETGIGLYRLRSPSWGAAAYIISRSCAQKMMDIPENQHRVADYLLFDFDESPVARNFAIYQLSPAVVIQDKDIVNKSLRLHFKSDLDPDYVASLPMGTWNAFRTGNFRYLWRTLRGYKPLKYEV